MSHDILVNVGVSELGSCPYGARAFVIARTAVIHDIVSAHGEHEHLAVSNVQVEFLS